MSERPPINSGQVDWSGENPGLYLKERDDGAFVTLISFFRVVYSPRGRGHALVLVEAPDRAGGGADGLNVCVTDNEAMARWLVSDFATQFSAFRGTKALDSLEYRAFHGASRGGDGIASYTETVTGDGIEARLAWDDLSAPFMVEMPPAQSATGKHEMFSLFVDAGRGSATVNGRPVLGHAVPRDFAGRRSSTAFLAFSETWVVPS